MRGAASRAEAEELKSAQIPLEQEIAAVRAGTHANAAFNAMGVDGFLEHRATDAASTASGREAAMHKAAALGRDGVVRNLTNHAGVDQQALQRAIGANGGALVGKAPDTVKGARAAFDSFTGKDMSQWSAGTAAAFMGHVEGLHAAGDTAGVSKALTDFASAARDIQGNPNLQGEFGGNTGMAFAAEAARLNGIAGLTGITSAFGAIGTDGKIR